MRPQTAKAALALVVILVLAASLALSSPAAAQDGKTIDLFEGQSEMSAGKIELQAVDGGPLVAGESDPSNDIGGGFTLPFEKNGSSILVPAKIDGKAVYFIFDTGATITSIGGAFVAAAGLSMPKDGPVMNASTANGQTVMRLGIINSLRLGGRDHNGVTFADCPGCNFGAHKGKPVVGLLGMNVIGRYRTTFDHGAGQIEMAPSGIYSDRWRDIQPWVEVQFSTVALHRNGKDWYVHGTVKNRSRRSIREVTVQAWCADGPRFDAAKGVPAGSTKKFQIVVKKGDCNKSFDRAVTGGRW